MNAPLYFVLVVGLSVLLTAVFRRLRADDQPVASLEDNVEFERKMEALERRVGDSAAVEDQPRQRPRPDGLDGEN